jgi:hypothetical protein
MATITFLQNNQALSFENIALALETMENWATRNGFENITLHLESEHKLMVQLGTEALLSSWVDLTAVQNNDAEALDDQLDFARGEYRRRMAGYGKFDR